MIVNTSLITSIYLTYMPKSKYINHRTPSLHAKTIFYKFGLGLNFPYVSGN